MTIQKKKSKSLHPIHPSPSKIEEIINRGGAVKEDKNSTKSNEIRFTMRIPKEILKKIDHLRKLRVGNVSRNQWIIEALEKVLK